MERARLTPRHEIPPLLKEANDLVAILMASAKTAVDKALGATSARQH